MKTIGRVALLPVQIVLFSAGVVAFSIAYWYIADLLPISETTPGYTLIFLVLIVLWAWVLSGLKHLLIRR